MPRPLALTLTVLAALAVVANLALGGPNWVAFLAVTVAAVATVSMLRTDPEDGDG